MLPAMPKHIWWECRNTSAVDAKTHLLVKQEHTWCITELYLLGIKEHNTCCGCWNVPAENARIPLLRMKWTSGDIRAHPLGILKHAY